MSLSEHPINLVLAVTLAGGLWLLPSADTVAAEGGLSLRDAERLALELDPVSKGYASRSEAYSDESVAEGQLPDPALKLGTMSLPVSRFNIDEPMTQFQIGLQQSIPPGQTLRYKREYAKALSDQETARSLERALQVLREVRLRFLELYYRDQSAKILQQYRDLFAGVQAITERQYAAGRNNQHDVLRAQLELSLVDDRLLETAMQHDAASGDLARYLTAANAGRPITDEFPEFPPLPDKSILQERLLAHPLIRIEDEALLASKKKISEAEQQFKPGYSIDVTYGIRPGSDPVGRSLPNMLTAMVMVDLPLFTSKRQDKRLSAAVKESQSMQYERTARLFELNGMLEREQGMWQRLNERVALYEQRVVDEARQSAEASLKAYQNDITDFTTLLRAQLTELNTQLDLLQVRVDRARSQARLLYLTGEL